MRHRRFRNPRIVVHSEAWAEARADRFTGTALRPATGALARSAMVWNKVLFFMGLLTYPLAQAFSRDYRRHADLFSTRPRLFI